MATEHVVLQGEHLSKISAKYGFLDYRTIWDHPQNADLKALRKTPNVLLPGDSVHIPDKLQKQESRATGQLHRFQIPSQRLFLHLVLKDWANQPLTNTDCVLQLEGKAIALKTDSNGRIKMPISITEAEATLTFKDPMVPFDLVVPIKIGHLDPVDSASGQMARLSNLGYITRPLEDVDDTVMARPYRSFNVMRACR